MACDGNDKQMITRLTKTRREMTALFTSSSLASFRKFTKNCFKGKL